MRLGYVLKGRKNEILKRWVLSQFTKFTSYFWDIKILFNSQFISYFFLNWLRTSCVVSIATVIIIIITDFYSAFRSEDTEALVGLLPDLRYFGITRSKVL